METIQAKRVDSAWLRFTYKIPPHMSYFQEMKRRNHVLSNLSKSLLLEAELERRCNKVKENERNNCMAEINEAIRKCDESRAKTMLNRLNYLVMGKSEDVDFYMEEVREMIKQAKNMSSNERKWTVIKYFLNPRNLYNYIKLYIELGLKWKNERRLARTIDEESEIEKKRKEEEKLLRESCLTEE